MHYHIPPVSCSTRSAIYPKQCYWMGLFLEKGSFKINLHHGRRGTPVISIAAAGSLRLRGHRQRGKPYHGAKTVLSPYQEVQQSLDMAIRQTLCNFMEREEGIRALNQNHF